MKKISFLLLLAGLAVMTSACTSQTATTDDTFNNQAVVPTTVNTIDTTPPPAATSPEDSNSISNNNATMEVTNTTSPAAPGQQENLVGQYSQALIKTSLGDIKVKFYGSDSPVTVNNFLNLAKTDFYNNTKFHRVIKGFMIQGGDPLSKGSDTSRYGTGGPGYTFKDEFNSHKLVVGSLAMANSGADTNGSQFFIVTAEATPWLDGHHTNFGEVISGLDIVKKIEAVETIQPGVSDRPTTDIVINSVELLK